MYRTLLVCFVWLAGSGFCVLNGHRPTVFLIGDSTMATFSARYAPMTGWGHEFHSFFTDAITIDNRAVAGKSSRSFIEEGKWARVLSDVQEGDYVLIQFGHNDQKRDHRYSDPYTAYQKFLTQYVRETRQRGGIPVLVTPVARRRFDRRGALLDTHGDYPPAMRELASELTVPLIDLHRQSSVYFEQLGEESTKEVFLWLAPGEEQNYPRGVEDNTHFSKHGAQEVGKLVVAELKDLDIPLKNYLKDAQPPCQNVYRAISIAACQGDSVRIGDEFRTDAGEYRVVYQSQQGCDSVVTTTLRVVPASFYQQSITIAEGDSVRTGPHYRYQAGTYYDTLSSSLGCDSVVVTTLSVTPPPTITQRTIALCAGDSLWAEGSYQKHDGVFYDTLASSRGYDSVVVTTLLIAPSLATPTVLATHDTLRSSVTGDVYRWFFNGQALEGTASTLVPEREGHYAVAVVAGSCVSSLSAAYHYTPVVTSTRGSVPKPVPLRVYRAESGTALSIVAPATTGRSAVVYIHDLRGHRIYRGNYRTWSQKIPFDQAEGIYVVTLVEAGKQTTVRFYWSD